jgi:hypothetical protein
MKSMIQGLLMVGLLMSMGSGFGQSTDAATSLRDPTRPPPGLLRVYGNSKALAESDGRAANAAGMSDSRVQVLKIGRSRQFAIIDGQLMQPGDVVDQWRLVSIQSQGVVLQSATETQTISSTPLVEKTLRAERGPREASHQNSTRGTP